MGLTIFNPWLMNHITQESHLMFLGHVQTAVSVGIVSLFISYLLKLQNYKSSAFVLSAFALLYMLLSATLTSFFAIFFICSYLVVVKYNIIKKLLQSPVHLFFGIYFIVNIFLIFYSLYSNLYILFGFDFSFSGRTIIWKEVFNLLEHHWLFGYGAYGVLIKTFWSTGMNYAHNDFMQHLLDGGIILTISFYLFMISACVNINKTKITKLKITSNACLILVLLVMLFESISESNYLFLLLSYFVYLPNLCIKQSVQEGEIMGLYRKYKLKFNKLYYGIKIKKRAKFCGENLYVGGKSYVTTNTYLGSNVNFNGMSIMGNGNVSIGDYFHSGINCQIITSFHNYDNGNAIPYDNTFINKDVTIKENVWIGNNVIILGGSTIGEGAIVQAGSVVVKDIPPFAIAGGHPAIVYKYRDIDHYMRLKRESKFY
ncbi:O-antigen ligase family protein [Amedibacillus sp. YH-ame10]